MNLIDALRHHVRLRPHDVAVAHTGGSVSYLQLAELVTSVAARMRAEGVAPGHHAGVFVTDPFMHLVVLLAAAVNGTVTVSAHPNYDPIPAAAELDVLVCDRDPGHDPSLRRVLVGPGWLGDSARGSLPLLPAGEFTDPGAIFRMVTSSGTTGVPKVVGYTVGRTQAMCMLGLVLDPITRGPTLSMMTLSTVGGFSVMAVLWHGGMAVLAMQPMQVMRSINLFKVLALRGSPQQLQGLMDIIRAHPVRFPSLEKIEIGGSSIPPSLLLALRATMCPNVIGVYGSTEAGLVAQVPAVVLHGTPDAAGYVVPDVKVRIVNDAGREVGLDAEGHVQIRSPYVADGYMNDDEATRATFRDGWFIPGDLGVLRSDGLLRITGRADEIINTGGVKLNPALVDDFLVVQRGISDAAAFAYRHPGRADEVWAAVVCTPDFDEQAVLAAARGKLNARAPVRLVRLDAIPRNAMGKPLRQQLSEQHKP